MTDAEYNEFMNMLVSEFDALGAKLMRRGLLAQEWKHDIIRLPAEMAQQVLRRWVRRFNTEPSIDRFMTLVDEIQEENAKRHANYRESSAPSRMQDMIGDALTDAELRARSEDDAPLWGSLHVALAFKLMNAKPEEKEAITRETYTAIEHEYPQFRMDCLNAVAAIGINHDGPVPF